MAHWLWRVKEQKAGPITNTHHEGNYQSHKIVLHCFDIVLLLSSNEISAQLCAVMQPMKQYLINIVFVRNHKSPY